MQYDRVKRCSPFARDEGQVVRLEGSSVERDARVLGHHGHRREDDPRATFCRNTTVKLNTINILEVEMNHRSEPT